MTDKDDILSTEVSVSAKLDESGLTAKAKSRAVAALDRLIGSAIDIPGAWLEGISRRSRIRNKTKELLTEADGAAALEHVVNSSQLGERTAAVFLAELERKQRNRDAIALQAAEELLLLPAPDEPEDNSSQADFVDDDWMNFFSTHAENASSEHLQILWSRILAGEIRKPGSFSLTTLRTISELDKDIAQTFQEKVIDRFEDGFLPKSDDHSGKELLDLTFLEEVGLLQEVNGLLGRDLDPNSEGFHFVRNGDKLLKIGIKSRVRLSLIRITRVGREIASILPKEAPERALLRTLDLLKKNVESAELCQVVEFLPDGKIRYVPIRTLHGPFANGI